MTNIEALHSAPSAAEAEQPKIVRFDWMDEMSEFMSDSGQIADVGAMLQPQSDKTFARPNVLVVNLFGGPCTGKSTNAALLFGKLKIAGVNAELVPEYAKDLTWENRTAALGFQPYVTSKQLWRIARLRNEVEVIVTDLPFILGLAYPGWGSTPNFTTYLLEIFDLFHNYNVFLRRNANSGGIHAYNPVGRKQTESEAIEKDYEVHGLLKKHEIAHEVVDVQEGEATANYLTNQVLALLDHRKGIP